MNQHICGAYLTLEPDTWFVCLDYANNIYKQCYSYKDNYYQCLSNDGKDWEHPQWMEGHDFKDDSQMTSLDTDGLIETTINEVKMTFTPSFPSFSGLTFDY